MEGKKGLILGVANENSISWDVAKRCKEEGAELAFTYQNEKTLMFTKPLFDSIGSEFYQEMNVQDEQSIQRVMKELDAYFEGELDFIVHSVAGGPKKGELEGRFIDTSKEGFMDSMLVSVFSLNMVLRETLPMLKKRQGSVISMTYLGSERVVSNYNVMKSCQVSLRK